MLADYEFLPHRWLALKEVMPLGLRVRGKLSPRLLAQELVAEPWHVDVACILLNRARREQAHPTLWRVLFHHRTLESLASADPDRLYSMVHQCGFMTKRVDALMRMATDVLGGSPKPFGLGQYAMASREIFIEGRDAISCSDHELLAFQVWSRNRGVILWRR